MKIKAGDTWYDGHEEPVMVKLTEQDKKNIANMDPKATKYCVFPNDTSRSKIDRWMKDET